MKLIVFYFNSTLFPSCIVQCYPMQPNMVYDNNNGFQFTTIPKAIFERHMQMYSIQYDFQDITGFSETPEADILHIGLHNFVRINISKKENPNDLTIKN